MRISFQIHRFGLANSERPGLFRGPPPSFGNAPMPLMSMPTVMPVRLFPQSSAPFMASVPPPPSNILPPSLSNAFSQPPPPRLVAAAAVVVTPQPTDLAAAYSRLAPTSRQFAYFLPLLINYLFKVVFRFSAAPRPLLSGAFTGSAPTDGNWDRMVEDFVKRTSRQRPTMDRRPSPREDRSRSPPPRRRVRSKSPDDSSQQSSMYERDGQRRRLATEPTVSFSFAPVL